MKDPAYRNRVWVVGVHSSGVTPAMAHCLLSKALPYVTSLFHPLMFFI